ncbi:MAG TPA: sulfatase-like hydrolase/transferase [Draconibacterium sp.]|nr:sulfatase-like hydrolase/transferase [Draconibacterium sp.]
MTKILITVFVALTFIGCSQKKNEKKKMNLLFIWTDQQRFDTMKAYGNDKIKVPNLNKLAEKSIVFLKAYVTQPVCTPSRSSVMTGLYPHTSGCVENNIPLKQETKTLPELINDSDYKTAYMGKWHLGDEVFAQHGFDEWYATEDGYNNYYSSTHDKNTKSAYYHWLIKKGIKPDSDDEFSRSFASNLPLDLGKPKFLEEKAIEFLEKNKDNPFILYVNFLEPHSPFSSTLNDYHNLEDLILPEDKTVFDSLTYRNMLRKLSKDGIKTDEVPDFVRRYWGLVSKVDMSVGNILNKLKELGLEENTLIVYTSDHGEMLGSHGFTAKRYAYDESSHIPLLIKLPGEQSQRFIKKPVSQIDIVPTLIDYMGYKTDAPLQGKSLSNVLNGGELKENYVFFEMAPLIGILKENKITEDILDKTHLSRNEAHEILYAHYRVVVSPDGWKMVVSDKDKNELFNLNSDPDEYENLYYRGQNSEVIKRLSEKLINWQKETGDSLTLRF